MYVLQNTSRRLSMTMSTEFDNPQEQTQHRREPYVEGNVKLLNILECSSEVMCIRFSADGNVLAAGLSEGIIKIFSPDTGQCHYVLKDEDTYNARLPVTSIRFVPFLDSAKIEHTHLLMATYASGMIKFWHYTSSSCVGTINEERQTLASAFSPLGTTFITTGADSTINVYDLMTKSCVRSLAPSDSRSVMNGHQMRVLAAQYHPLDGHIFITGGWDDTVQFWDDREKHSIRKLFGPHICGDALDIDASHNHILTGSWRKDDVLQIWDFASGEKIKDVPQDPLNGSLMYCAQWLGKENIVCGGCEHNMARVVDRGTLNTVGQLVDLPSGVFCLDHDRTVPRPRIAVGSAKSVYLLKMEKRHL